MSPATLGYVNGSKCAQEPWAQDTCLLCLKYFGEKETHTRLNQFHAGASLDRTWVKIMWCFRIVSFYPLILFMQLYNGEKNILVGAVCLLTDSPALHAWELCCVHRRPEEPALSFPAVLWLYSKECQTKIEQTCCEEASPMNTCVLA